jgi:hypothetical protein
MKLAAELDDRYAHREFHRFLKNTGRNIWEKKIAKTESLHRFPHPSPNFYRASLAKKNPLTNAIATFFKLEKEGKLLRKHATDELMTACWYLKVCNSLFNEYPESSEKLRAIIIDDETISSFLFEIDIATHFFRFELDVQFVDFADKARFDLLITDEKNEFEIECKTKSADAGKRIPRTHFDLLCDVIGAEWSAAESFAVLLKCPGRLSGSQVLFHEVAEEIRRSRKKEEHKGQVDTLRFEIRPLPFGTAITSEKEAEAALAPYWAANGTGALFHRERTANFNNRLRKHR